MNKAEMKEYKTRRLVIVERRVAGGGGSIRLPQYGASDSPSATFDHRGGSQFGGQYGATASCVSVYPVAR